MSQRKRPPARRTLPSRPSRPSASRSKPVPSRAPAPKPFLTPNGTPFRHAVERRSAIVAIFLRGLPRAVPGLIVIGLVVAGLLGPPVVGGAVLLVVALLLTWLSYLSWPALPLPGRLIRLVVVALVVAYAFVRFGQ